VRIPRRPCSVILSLVVVCCTAPLLHAADDAPAPYVSPTQAKQWVDAGRPVAFLDVREPDEFAAGHLPGAKNIPHTDVVARSAELPTDRPLVVYCIHSAHRAPEAAKQLRAHGFANAYVLEGGIVAWHAGGLSIQANDLAAAPRILPLTTRCEFRTAPYPSTAAPANASVADNRRDP